MSLRLQSLPGCGTRAKLDSCRATTCCVLLNLKPDQRMVFGVTGSILGMSLPTILKFCGILRIECSVAQKGQWPSTIHDTLNSGIL